MGTFPGNLPGRTKWEEKKKTATEWSNWLRFKIFIDLFFDNKIPGASVEAKSFLNFYFDNANRTECEANVSEIQRSLSWICLMYFRLMFPFLSIFFPWFHVGERQFGAKSCSRDDMEDKNFSREVDRKNKFNDVRHVLRSIREGNKLGNSSSIKLKMIFSLCLQNRWRKWEFRNQISGNYANRTIKQGRRIMFAIKQNRQGNLFYRFFTSLFWERSERKQPTQHTAHPSFNLFAILPSFLDTVEEPPRGYKALAEET